MRIDSNGDTLVATLPESVGVVWNRGSHYANVYIGWESHDPIMLFSECFSFAWEKNHTSMLDFTTALENYITDEI